MINEPASTEEEHVIFGVRARQRKRWLSVSVRGVAGTQRSATSAEVESAAKRLIDNDANSGTRPRKLVRVRQMALADFKEQQEAGLDAPHVAQLNAMIRRLTKSGPAPVPFISPYHGGADARVLTLLRDPGPKADATKGSGYLCIQNDDPSAESQALQFAAAGIEPSDVTPWNAYPWYINRAPTPNELGFGADALASLLEITPEVSVIMLQGVDAKKGWSVFRTRHRELIEDRKLSVVGTCHPSPQALFHPDPEVQARRYKHRMHTAAEVAAILRGDLQVSHGRYERIDGQPPQPTRYLPPVYGAPAIT